MTLFHHIDAPLLLTDYEIVIKESTLGVQLLNPISLKHPATTMTDVMFAMIVEKAVIDS